MTKNKKLWIAVAALSTLVLWIGCIESQTDLSIEGEATRGIYWNPIYPERSQYEYHVEVTVKNTGTSPIVFDEVEVVFYPEYGRSLRVITVPINKPYFELIPGTTTDFEYATNGYTLDLLIDAGDRPLKLFLTLRRNGRTVGGPYMTVLPNIQRLPSHTETLIDKNVKGYKLVFSSGSVDILGNPKLF